MLKSGRTFSTKECAILANPESKLYKSCLNHLAEKFFEAENSELPQEYKDETGVRSLKSDAFAAVFMKAIHDGSLQEVIKSEKPNPNAIIIDPLRNTTNHFNSAKFLTTTQKIS